MFNERQRRWRQQALERFEAVADPVEKHIPEHDGQDQDNAFGNRLVFLGKAILSRIGYDDDHQDISDAVVTKQRRLLAPAQVIAVVQDRRMYIWKISSPFLFVDRRHKRNTAA